MEIRPPALLKTNLIFRKQLQCATDESEHEYKEEEYLSSRSHQLI